MRANLYLLPLLVAISIVADDAADEHEFALIRKREFFNSMRSRTDDGIGDTNLTQAYALFFTAAEFPTDPKFDVAALKDKNRFVDFMRRAATEMSITNLGLAEIESAYTMWTNIFGMFSLHPDLPPSLYNWPPPRLSNTNSMVTVKDFIEKHGWNMHTNEQFILSMGVRTAPLTGVPWPEIDGRTFDAVTRDGILYVVMRGFGAETDGIAWNPLTNRFDGGLSGFKPLGNGWYAWHQTGNSSAEKIYEGQKSKTANTSVEPTARAVSP